MNDTRSSIVEPQMSPEFSERRYVYNGDTVHGYSGAMPRGNRPLKRRKRSPFNIVLVVIAISLFIVFYIWNKIAVNRLAIELNDLEAQHQKILNATEILRADINRKS